MRLEVILLAPEAPTSLSLISAMCVQYEDDPTRCPASCGQQIQCGHICTASCGLCFKHQTSSQSTRDAAPEGSEVSPSHLPCHQKCSRPLVCGHPCTRTCHAATEACSDCSRACPMACPHARCGLGCSQVRFHAEISTCSHTCR